MSCSGRSPVPRLTILTHTSTCEGKLVMVRFFCSATYTAMLRPATLYNCRKWQLIGKSQWCRSTMLQLQHTPPPQSTTPCLHPVSIHQMAPSMRGRKHPITASYLVYRPRKDERLSRPGWLVTYWNKVPPSGVEHGHVTHPSTNRARHRVTSLIRPTPLRLCHAVNQPIVCRRSHCVKLISFSITMLWLSLLWVNNRCCCPKSTDFIHPWLQSLPQQYSFSMLYVQDQVQGVLRATMLTGGGECWAGAREDTARYAHPISVLVYVVSLDGECGRIRSTSATWQLGMLISKEILSPSFVHRPIPGLDRDLIGTEYWLVMVRSQVAVSLWLIGKPEVDLLLVLIEHFFRQLSWLSSRYWSKLWFLKGGWVSLSSIANVARYTDSLSIQ